MDHIEAYPLFKPYPYDMWMMTKSEIFPDEEEEDKDSLMDSKSSSKFTVDILHK